MQEPPWKPIERTRGRKLQRTRARVLSRSPLCVHCLVKGHTILAAEVDHIVPLLKGGADTEDNMQGLCESCHKAKTAEDMGYTLRPKVVVGIDGYPIGVE